MRISDWSSDVCSSDLPTEIENKLKVSPFVKAAVVIGDQRKHLVALLGIELDTVSNWALPNRIGFTTYADLSSNPEVVDLIAKCVAEANAELALVETVKSFALLPTARAQAAGGGD